MSAGVIVARIVDAGGMECARAAVDPSAEIWYFALTRAALPAFVQTPGNHGLWMDAVRLQPHPMRESDIVAVHVRVPVSVEAARAVLWLVAVTTWWQGRFR